MITFKNIANNPFQIDNSIFLQPFDKSDQFIHIELCNIQVIGLNSYTLASSQKRNGQSVPDDTLASVRLTDTDLFNRPTYIYLVRLPAICRFIKILYHIHRFHTDIYSSIFPPKFARS